MKVEAYLLPAQEGVKRLQSIAGGKGEKILKRLLRVAMTKGRRELTNTAKAMLQSLSRTEATQREGHPRDPRKAWMAVKTVMYRRMIGANVSILNKRKAGSLRSTYRPPHRLKDGQRGGRRWGLTRSGRTEQLDSYYGSDRGFILRFMNAGTEVRHTRHGARGSLTGARGWVQSAEAKVLNVIMREWNANIDAVIAELWDGGKG